LVEFEGLSVPSTIEREFCPIFAGCRTLTTVIASGQLIFDDHGAFEERGITQSDGVEYNQVRQGEYQVGDSRVQLTYDVTEFPATLSPGPYVAECIGGEAVHVSARVSPYVYLWNLSPERVYARR
jgi:hypothetical protein